MIFQQVKLMGPKSLRVCLVGYLAPIYKKKDVLTRVKKQEYRFTSQEGGLDEEVAEEKEDQFATEVESNTETESDSVKAVSVDK